MSTASIDTARITERLSAFLSRVEEAEPVDNIFVDLPTLNEAMKSKMTIDGGRQSMIALDTAQNSTIASFSGYDTFNLTPQDTARTAVYAFINYGGTVTISWEEMRETSNSDVRVFDLVAHKRRNAIASMKDRINSDLYVAVPAALDVNSIPQLISTTAAAGGIAAGGFWAAQENAAVGAFAANGLVNMRDSWNDVVRQGQGTPDTTLTTQAIFQAYEAAIDPDVRYSSADKLSRGATVLEWKGKPIMFDADMTAGEMYMINWKWIKLYVDTDGNFNLDKFIEPSNQKAYTAKLVFRGQMVMDNRRALARLAGIT